MNSKNSTPGDQTGRKKHKYETLRPSIFQIQIWDSKVQKSPENETFETHQKCFKDFEIGPKSVFWDPRFSRYHSTPLKCKVQLTSDTLYQFISTIKWMIKGFLLRLWPISSPTLRTVELWSLFTTSSLNLFSLLWRETRGTLYII